jgi:hypothetical protein
LTPGDHAADVISDQIVSLGKGSSNSQCPDHEIRLIQIRCTPHKNRTGGKAKGSTPLVCLAAQYAVTDPQAGSMIAANAMAPTFESIQPASRSTVAQAIADSPKSNVKTASAVSQKR